MRASRLLLLTAVGLCVSTSFVGATDPAAPAGADGEKAKKAEKDAKRKASGDRMGARVEAGMGDKALKGRKLKKALKHYAKAISMDPSNMGLYMKRATAFMVTGKSQKARKDLDYVIEKDPKHVQAYMKRGRVCKAMGSFEEALRDYKKVQELKPGNKKVEADLPLLAQAVEQEKLAKEYHGFAKAAEAQNDVGTAQHWYTQAYEQLEQALKVAPDAFGLLLMASEALVSKGDYASAIQSTGRLLKLRPDAVDGYLLRGRAYLFEGEVDVAYKHFKEGYKSDQTHKALKHEYKRLKKYNKIKGDCEAGNINVCWDALKLMHGEDGVSGTEMDRVTSKLREHKCKHMAANGMAQEAYACAERVLQHDGNSIEAYKARGKANLLLENWDQAVHDYQQAVQHSGQEDQEAMEGLDEAQRMLHKSKQKDYYGVLNVDKRADKKAIKKAYRAMAMEWHPDKHTGEEEKKVAEKKFHEIAEAYEILNDDEMRGKFDRGEEIKPEGNGGGGGHNPFQHFQHGGQQFHFQH